MTEEKELTKIESKELVCHDETEYSMLFDSARFTQAWRVAKLFSESKMVPSHFQGNPAGVFVVMHMATRLGLDVFMCLQNMYMVHGRPGMEAKMMIALVNARGPFTGPIQWEESGEGDKRQWTAYATHKATGERCAATVTWEMVKAEGWAAKDGSKWRTLPSLMGRYRSAAFLARLFCPEVVLGLHTADELEDAVIDLDVDTPKVIVAKSESKPTQTEKIKRRLRKPKEPLEPPQDITPPQETVEVQGNGNGPVQGISEASRTFLLAVRDTQFISAWDKLGLGDNLVPISELDEPTAQKLIGELKK